MNVIMKSIVYFAIGTVGVVLMITCEQSLGFFRPPILAIIGISYLLLLQSLVLIARGKTATTAREKRLVRLLIAIGMILAVAGSVLRIIGKTAP